MSAIEPRPLRADARRNRERVVDAAREVFAQCEGGPRVEEIARRAGVGVGTVYRHFPTKDALIGEIVRSTIAEHVEVARRWTEQEPDPWRAFEGFLRETWTAMATDSTRQRLMWVTDDAAFAHAADVKPQLTAVVGAMIDRAQAQGTLRPDLRGEDIPAIMCAVGGVMSAQNSLSERWPQVVEFLLDGLRAPR